MFCSQKRKNTILLKNEIMIIINDANRKYSTCDCYPFFKDGINAMIKNSPEFIKSLDCFNDNYEKYAYKILYNVGYSLLCSGNLHIYRGMLNTAYPIQAIKYIVHRALDYAVEINEITKEQRNEQLEILEYNIKNVG